MALVGNRPFDGLMSQDLETVDCPPTPTRA